MGKILHFIKKKYNFIKFILILNILLFFSELNIFGLFYDKKKIIKLFSPLRKYYCFYPRTILFKSQFRNNTEKYKVNFVDLKDNITYYINNFNYYVYLKLLKNHGLVRSKFDLGNHSLIIDDNMKYNLNRNFSKINKYTKIYQYINANYLFQKDLLYNIYLSMKKKFNDDFNYMPETLYFPKDKYIIENKFKNYSLDLNNLWLIKPKDKFGGQGISIFKSLKAIKLKEYILTNYITNVNLIKNKKYDLRLYVLVSGLKPLRIYFNKEGLVRIASEKFSLNINSIGNKFIHLTNTDINKNNKNYIFPVSNEDENSNIWNLKLYKIFLKKNNINWDELKEKIIEIFIKTIISYQQKLIDGIEELNLSDTNFYNLFGFDILITDSYDPVLLEVNYSPCMDIIISLSKTNLLDFSLSIIIFLLGST